MMGLDQQIPTFRVSVGKSSDSSLLLATILDIANHANFPKSDRSQHVKRNVKTT